MSILIRFSEAAVPPTQPSTFTRNLLLAGVLASWALTASAPVFATVGLQNGVEIKPPPRSEVTQQLIRSTWEPKEVSVPRRFVPQGAVEAGPLQPLRIAEAVLASWQPVPVDIPRRFVPQVIEQADNPPPFTRVPASVLSSWDVAQDAALWSATGYQTGIDPVPSRQSPHILNLLLDSWVPVEPVVQGRRFTEPVIAPADNPPPLRQDTAIRLLLESWLPPAPTEQGRRYVQPVVPPGDPPPPYVRIPDALYASWNLTESGALWTATGYQDGPTIASDNPPVGYRPWLAVLQEQEQRYVLDRELWPTPKRPVVTPSGPEIVPDNPPPGRRDWLQSVAQSWEPPQPKAVWFNRLIDLSVKPIKRYDNLYVILDTWMPPPQPRQRRPVVTPSGPTPDNPPTGYQPWLALLQEQELRHVRDRELWPRPRPPVVSESGPAIVAVYREIVIRGNDPSGTEDYYEQWFG